MPRIKPAKTIHLVTTKRELPPPGKHKGAHSELIACAWLLAEGYEVFRNISPYGLADIIAWKDGKMLLLDVKSTVAHLSPEQLAVGVVPLVVSASGRCRIGFVLR